jgi:hypothetical protein
LIAGQSTGKVVRDVSGGIRGKRTIGHGTQVSGGFGRRRARNEKCSEGARGGPRRCKPT